MVMEIVDHGEARGSVSCLCLFFVYLIIQNKGYNMTTAEYENDFPGRTYLHPRTPFCFSTKYTTLRSGGPGRSEGEILPTSRRGPGGPLGPPERLFSYSVFPQIVVLLQYVFCAFVGCHDVAAGAILGAGLMSVNTF